MTEFLAEGLADAAAQLHQEELLERDLGAMHARALRRAVDVARRDFGLRNEGNGAMRTLRQLTHSSKAPGVRIAAAACAFALEAR
jgi:hypothetical protein